MPSARPILSLRHSRRLAATRLLCVVRQVARYTVARHRINSKAEAAARPRHSGLSAKCPLPWLLDSAPNALTLGAERMRRANDVGSRRNSLLPRSAPIELRLEPPNRAA